MELWSRIFGARPKTGKSAADDADSLYAEFSRGFCHRPDVNFVSAMQAESQFALLSWLHPSTPCALSKAFVKLGVDVTRGGLNIWEQPYIEMMHVGGWDNGGLPPQSSLDALATLAHVLGIRIKLFYRPAPEAEVMVMEWDPIAPTD